MNRATAIVITSIISFVVFMISSLLLVICIALQHDELIGSSRSRSCIAKVATDTTLQERDVTELSSSIAAY
jgi:hypothetical protein